MSKQRLKYQEGPVKHVGDRWLIVWEEREWLILSSGNLYLFHRCTDPAFAISGYGKCPECLTEPEEWMLNTIKLINTFDGDAVI